MDNDNLSQFDYSSDEDFITKGLVSDDITEDESLFDEFRYRDWWCTWYS